MVSSRSQFRNDELMPNIGTPVVSVRLMVQMHREPTREPTHASDKETPYHLEQEERRQPVGPEPLAVVDHESNDLTLRQTELVQGHLIRSKTSEELIENAILGKRIDMNRNVRGWLTFFEVHPREIGVMETREHILGLGDGLFAIRRADHDILSIGDEAEVTSLNFDFRFLPRIPMLQNRLDLVKPQTTILDLPEEVFQLTGRHRRPADDHFIFHGHLPFCPILRTFCA